MLADEPGERFGQFIIGLEIISIQRALNGIICAHECAQAIAWIGWRSAARESVENPADRGGGWLASNRIVCRLHVRILRIDCELRLEKAIEPAVAYDRVRVPHDKGRTVFHGKRSGIEVLPVTGNQERVEARANVAVHLRGQDLCECFGHASSPRGEKENSDNHPRFHALMQAFPCNRARRPVAASCQLVSLGLASWQLAATGLAAQPARVSRQPR